MDAVDDELLAVAEELEFFLAAIGCGQIDDELWKWLVGLKQDRTLRRLSCFVHDKPRSASRHHHASCDNAACGIMPAILHATDRLAVIDPAVPPRPSSLAAQTKATGGKHELAGDLHHLLAGWSVALDRIGFVGRALLDSLYRYGGVPRQLFRNVLAGVAACGPHHRTALAPGSKVSLRMHFS